MQASSAPTRLTGNGVLGSLAELAAAQGLTDFAGRLRLAQELARMDLSSLTNELTRVRDDSVVERSAHHLLEAGGKRLRSLCLSLCAQLAPGANLKTVHDLAVAVELVHGATLLHDDVVDLGDTRRGRPTARTVYGNAASIFAGDWLLVDALRRVRRHDLPGTLDGLLSTIDEMIAAEAVQLEGRGRLRADRDTYFAVVQGKTAALFRWACGAGARAAGLPGPACAALESFGGHLGLAFQLADDLLDFEGDGAHMGKAPFADLREGKATFPLIVLLERDPSARPLLEPFARPDAEPGPDAVGAVLEAMARVRAADACRELARAHVDAAVQQLFSAVEPSPVREALAAVAMAAAYRDR